MTRKTFIRIHTALAALLAAITLPTGLNAQSAVGSWLSYNSFTVDNTKIVDTPKLVYLISDHNIYAFDKKGEELISYNLNTGLNDVGVESVYRDYDKNYVVVAYSNGNMDLIRDNGTIENLSDIKDAQSVTNRYINDIAFWGDEMLVATGFGLVRYDMKRLAVKESGNYGQPVTAVAVAGDNIYISTENHLYGIASEKSVSQLAGFTDLGWFFATSMEGISDCLLVANQGWNDGANAYIAEVHLDTPSLYFHVGYSFPMAMEIVRYGDAWQLSNPYGCYLVTPLGGNQFSVIYRDAPAEVRVNDKGVFNGGADPKWMWYSNKHGLGRCSVDENLQFAVAGDQILPFATTVDSGVKRIATSDDKIYFFNVASCRFPSYNDQHSQMCINVMENGFITDIPLDDVTVRKPDDPYLKTGFRVVEDPTDPSTIFVGTWFEGIHKIRNGKEVDKYDWRNMPLDSTYICAAMELTFDTQNNLWAFMVTMSGAQTMVLPAAKVKTDAVTTDDWVKIDVSGFGDLATRNPSFVACRSSRAKGLMLLSDGYTNDNLLAYNPAGNVTSTSGHTYYMRNKFTDQDGKVFGPLHLTTMVEDREGAVWVGTTDGVFAINNPMSMLNPNATVERLKVPRNDGTNLADYLLTNHMVTAIAVDGANRKWLGTNMSGVYLVSPDGRQVIENFTADNSQLPSNVIYDIKCDPNSNIVYIATEKGLVSYSSDSSPAMSDYSDVYAYPNPVRPEYTGFITVKGLMDNSLVKFTDSAGNLLYQTRSEGGMVTWDGCNSSGDRVRTGVYYVYASQNQDGTSGAVVAKILVVN